MVGIGRDGDCLKRGAATMGTGIRDKERDKE